MNIDTGKFIKFVMSTLPELTSKGLEGGIKSIMTKHVTDENVQMGFKEVMKKIVEYQKQEGKKFIISLETNANDTDMLIKVWERDRSTNAIIPLKDIYVSQVTAQQLNHLFFSNGTTDNSSRAAIAE